MAASSSAAFRIPAQVFKALGHPTRLQMVAALAEGERCVCDLTALAGLDMSTTSKHLHILVKAGVLSFDKRANKVFYQLHRPCVISMLTCLKTVKPNIESGRRACCG